MPSSSGERSKKSLSKEKIWEFENGDLSLDLPSNDSNSKRSNSKEKIREKNS